MVRYSAALNRYMLTNFENKLLMILLGMSMGYSFHIFSEILKNRKNPNSKELLKLKQKDPKFILKSVRGGDIFDPKNLDNFDPEEDFGLKLFKVLKRFNSFKITKDRAIECFEFLGSRTSRINNRQLIKLILKSLNLSLTKTDILSITPALLAVIIMNGGFSHIFFENMSNNVPLQFKRYSEYLKALVEQKQYLQVFNVIIATEKSDLLFLSCTAALTYFAYNSKIAWLIGLIRAQGLGALFGFIALMLAPVNTCFDFAIPMVPYTFEIPAKEKLVRQN